MDRTSWLGVPLTVPVPVTVIRAEPVDEVSAALTCVLGARCPAAEGAALPVVMPSANEPIRMAAAAPPTASGRYAGLIVMGMATPGVRGLADVTPSRAARFSSGTVGGGGAGDSRRGSSRLSR